MKENMIDITGADLTQVVKEVYELSEPIGMGFMHFTPDPLSDDEAKHIVNGSNHGDLRLSMDYVKGRCCKFNVWEDEGKLFIRDDWPDHTASHLTTLLERIGIER